VNGALALALATAEPQRAVDILATHPGVGHVEVVGKLDGITRLLVRTTDSRPFPDEIAGVLVRSNIKVTEFYRERATLDDVFREIAAGKAANSGAALRGAGKRAGS
jgi:hypothetical protein